MQAVYAQNLVPNHSFEQYDTCPYLGSQLQFAKPWFSPTENTPDYYNACALNYFNVPNAGSGYQEAFDGNAYAGFYLVELDNTSLEYIAVKLNESLEKDSSYCISFRISLSEFLGSYCTIEKVGVYLSNDSIFQNGTSFLHYTPQIRNDEPLTDPTIWYEVSGMYTATGGEQFLYIGNFDSTNNQFNCNYSNAHAPITVYAYVDYVTVIKAKCKEDIDSLLEHLPNVITPNNDGINDMVDIPAGNTDIRTFVYNRWGNLVFEHSGNNVFWDGTCHGNTCSNGVYYMVIQYEMDGKQMMKQIFIHLFN